MTALTPNLSAKLANTIYQIINYHNINDMKVFLARELSSIVSKDSLEIGLGKTGTLRILKSQTAFAFAAQGKGPLNTHGFFVFRGTEKSYKSDWLTNANNSTFGRSAYEKAVHDGFSRTFKTIKPQFKETLKAMQASGVATIHCIGHSLGGALASLCAEDIHRYSPYEPYLYTFGAPRIGLSAFANHLTNITMNKNFRVHHRTDIVPLVPYWPYCHAPTGGQAKQHDYLLPSPGEYASADWHDMGLYARSVKGATWTSLAKKQHVPANDHVAKRWLDQKGIFAFTPTNLRWLDNAFNFVLKLLTNTVAFGLNTLVMQLHNVGNTALSMFDTMAYILYKGINLTDSASQWVFKLICRMMEMLGMQPVSDQLKISQALIRSLFMQINQRARIIAQRAIDQVLVNGKAVSS